MVITIVGTGLIGGSLSLALQAKGFASKVIGVESNKEHAAKAIELGLVHECLTLAEAIQASSVIIIATPINAAEQLLPIILDKVSNQVVFDVGSTKSKIVEAVKNHPKRGRFVATHPMWGTENSGPSAAIKGAFSKKATVICDKSHSDSDALEMVETLYALLEMHILYMESTAHDMHVAYISHISHITSFALANTVLEKEREEDAIFELASGGFESTVRLAKSNAAMWVPIFMQNRDNILDVLNEHISQLRKFKSCLEKENEAYLAELIENANGIRRILK
ncbi:MAG: prephenate dehydrogenase [Sphingobacteriia bacterium 24-36-13]|jgi:prephenate dehydrogenase|uniref:prephenate dehydrogenase n=1 Tax=Sediminibacterium sp. TaxID=1917865 RepID=UPI000BC81B3C|nr:prephenate dehydrogenase [Sediminibacterium sp.]OYY10495.1 MAG: prephenate dehydrogenase [Sphingobacteriia bacterium 35-36-14]OYZ55409.1 MAG: prephenate dehydrogenase [Sphingobacteriia bacterium 24-36-13]OZA65237.1 MAG: prephenate dehydrogenase [Sphingobacteriia bacterium 39-36-14]HQS22957.1 prephenate dehydrogenase [Sediminibacterium sp.]HQS34971.1 prephenate dehydrogenase [Sediminibacterium sp.]